MAQKETIFNCFLNDAHRSFSVYSVLSFTNTRALVSFVSDFSPFDFQPYSMLVLRHVFQWWRRRRCRLRQHGIGWWRFLMMSFEEKSARIFFISKIKYLYYLWISFTTDERKYCDIFAILLHRRFLWSIFDVENFKMRCKKFFSMWLHWCAMRCDAIRKRQTHYTVRTLMALLYGIIFLFYFKHFGAVDRHIFFFDCFVQCILTISVLNTIHLNGWSVYWLRHGLRISVRYSVKSHGSNTDKTMWIERTKRRSKNKPWVA